MNPPRVVLDTNCLVSALTFSQGRIAWLRHAWQSGRFVPLVSRDTVSELRGVAGATRMNIDISKEDAAHHPHP